MVAVPHGFTEAEGRFVFAQLDAGATAAAAAERMDPPRTAREVQDFVRKVRKQFFITSLPMFVAACEAGRFRKKPTGGRYGHGPAMSEPQGLPERQELPPCRPRPPSMKPARLPPDEVLRRMIDAFPQDKITVCPKPESPAYDPAWDLPWIMFRQKKLGLA